MSKLKFYFYQNGSLVKKIAFSGSDPRTLSIGRESADITLQSQSVSRLHAQLIYDGADVYLTDCNSANGTFVNEKKLVSAQPRLLTTGDIVFFDSAKQVKMAVLDVSEVDIPGKDDSQNISIVSLLNQKAEITIGRNHTCDIVLPHHTVSRMHASVSKANGKYTIADQGSLNGVFVNGKRIKSAEFGVEDKIYIGRFQLSLHGGQRDLSGESAISANLISKVYKNGKHALSQSSFEVPSGGVVAIMGPSGCGKSTLLKILNGTILPTTGNILLNGLDLIDNFSYLKTQIGYVPQDDIVHKELTVRESIYFAAKIRLNGVSDEIIDKKTERLLEQLNIKHIESNLVSAISGGQRKRVCIAVELLSEPAILFLDEPTSPLDPETIDGFMGILRTLSKAGTTVIMVTHKPEDLSYMDQVIFLAEGGSLVFYGKADAYKEYFGVTTAVGVYSNISGKKAEPWIRKYADTGASQNSLPPAPNKRNNDKANPVTQFYWILSRYFRIKKNDQKNTLIMLLQAPIIATLICLVFPDIKLAVLFLMSICAIWFGVNNSAREIVSEVAIYKRERMFNMLIFPYVFSKIVMLAIFAIIQSVLFVSIVSIYYSFGDSSSDLFVKWESMSLGIAWMFFLTFCSSLLGLFVSSANDNTEKAMSIVPILIIPQIMLAGVVTMINNPLVELLSYFTISRWGTEGFTHFQSKVIESYMLDGILRKSREESYPIMKKSFHETYQMVFGSHAGTFTLDITVLMFIGLLCLAGIWISMVNKDKSQF